ncbi:hypothetical protein D3C71_250540 [compost metagenome]
MTLSRKEFCPARSQYVGSQFHFNASYLDADASHARPTVGFLDHFVGGHHDLQAFKQ